MLTEFKKFILRGNVVDMAVGIIIGAAFGAVVKSLVADIVMPPIGVLVGGVDFSNHYLVLAEGTAPVAPGLSLEAARATGAAVVAYGAFLNLIVNLLVVGFAVFLLVRAVNRLQGAPPPPDPTTKSCPECLSTIPIQATRCAHCAIVLPTG